VSSQKENICLVRPRSFLLKAPVLQNSCIQQWQPANDCNTMIAKALARAPAPLNPCFDVSEASGRVGLFETCLLEWSEDST
jgi:hypothetical protein